MSLNTEIPEIPIRRHTHWFVSIRVCRNIGVTGGIVVTYIELSVRFRIMIDFGCRSQDHGRPAMRTAEGSTALGSGLSFFQNSSSVLVQTSLIFACNFFRSSNVSGLRPGLRSSAAGWYNAVIRHPSFS